MKLKDTKEEKEIDQMLDRIKEDHTKVEEPTGQEGSELEKAKAVRTQKKICDQFLQQRILLQKPFSLLARFPQDESFIKAIDDSIVKTLINKNKRSIKTHMKNLTKL